MKKYGEISTLLVTTRDNHCIPPCIYHFFYFIVNSAEHIPDDIWCGKATKTSKWLPVSITKGVVGTNEKLYNWFFVISIEQKTVVLVVLIFRVESRKDGTVVW